VVVLPGRDQAAAVTTSGRSSRATASPDKPLGLPSSSDPPAKRFTPAEIAAKLRSIDALVSQGQRLADATRQAGISAATYHRWRQELGAQSSEPAKRPAEPGPEAPKRIVEGEASAVRDTTPRSKGHQDSTGFEE
jgi:transposase-like protein